MWMYSAGDADKGPVEFAVIESLVRTGHLDPESTVWTDGWDEWKEIRDVPALAVFLTSPTGLSRAQEGAPDAGRASLPGEVAVGAGAWFIAAGLFIYIGLRVGAMIGLLPPSVADDPELGATLTYFWLISVPVPFVLGVALVVQGALLIAGRQRGTVGPGVFAMIAGGAYAVALVLLGKTFGLAGMLLTELVHGTGVGVAAGLTAALGGAVICVANQRYAMYSMERRISRS